MLISQLVQVPTVLGWRGDSSAVSILGEMPSEQLEMILAHELHIRRYDYFWNLLQIAIETVLSSGGMVGFTADP